MPNEFVIKNGLVVQSGTTTVTGSVTATGGFTGSLFGTASYALSSAGGGGGGLTNWSESFSSATQATSQFIPNNAAATVNAALTPKGTGALIAQIPDGGTGGGNSRGSQAIDFQLNRSAANQVASAQYSVLVGGSQNQNNGYAGFLGGGEVNKITQGSRGVICGGVRNEITSTGADNFVGGGDTNKITGLNYSGIVSGFANTISQTTNFIGGGQSNTLNGSYSAIGAGQSNISYAAWVFIGSGLSNNAGQDYSSVVGGRSNTTNSNYSAILGGYQGFTSLYGQQAYAAGRFSADGDAQSHELVWRRAITGTTITELFLDGASIAAILPSTNAIWHGIIDIAAVCTTQGNGTTVVGDVEATSYKATIKRLNTTTSLVGTVQEIGTSNSDTSMSTGVFTIDNNDTNESLRVQYTPPTTAGSTTVIRVVATFRGIQIQY